METAKGRHYIANDKPPYNY